MGKIFEKTLVFTLNSALCEKFKLNFKGVFS